MPDVEVMEPEEDTPTNGHGLAVRRSDAEPDIASQVRQAAMTLELKWAKEREERSRWSAEDKRDTFYARLVAQLAAATLAEGAVGTRPKAGQIADTAFDIADEVMRRLDARGHFKPKVDTTAKAT